MTVVEMETVVCGGNDVAGRVDPAATGVVEAGGLAAAGIGLRVIVFGTLVTIPGLAGMCGAQIPAK